MLFTIKKQRFILASTEGVGNIRPVGKIRAARPFHVTRRQLQKQVIHRSSEDVNTFSILLSLSPISSVENRSSKDLKTIFFSFHLYSSNNPVRERLRLPTCGPPTNEVAHPCCTAMVSTFLAERNPNETFQRLEEPCALI